MEFPIILYSGDNNSLPFVLKVSQQQESVILEYKLADGTNFIVDDFSIFKAIRMDELDSQTLSIIGPVTRKIRFDSSLGFSNFCTFLNQVYDMKASVDSNGLLTFGESKLSKNSLNKPKHRPFQTITFTESMPTEEFNFSTDFTSDFLWQKPVVISPDETGTLYPNETFKSVIPFSVVNPELSTIAILWTSILLKNKKDFLSDYLKLKKQWETITSFQWKNDKTFRNYVEQLEKSVDRSNFKTPQIREILFNINVSLYFYYNRLTFDSTIYKFTELFVSIFVIGSVTDGKICLRTDEVLSIDAATAKIFFIFTNFHHQYLYQKTFSFSHISDMILSVQTIINKFCPSLSNSIAEISLENFEYVINQFYCYLINVRPNEDIILLVSSILANPQPGIFMRCLICSSIKMFVDFLGSMNHLSQTPFESAFDQFITTTNFRLLLHNGEMLHSHIAPFIVSFNK